MSSALFYYHISLNHTKGYLKAAKALVRLYFNQNDFNSSKIIINNFKKVHPSTYAFIAVEALILFLEHSEERLFE
jgi:hypothetical protein